MGQKVVVSCRRCNTYGVSYLKRLFRIKKGASITRIDFLGCTLSRETFASFHEKEGKEKNPPEGAVFFFFWCNGTDFFPAGFQHFTDAGK